MNVEQKGVKFRVIVEDGRSGSNVTGRIVK
jgi:hypothetical protein